MPALLLWIAATVALLYWWAHGQWLPRLLLWAFLSVPLYMIGNYSSAETYWKALAIIAALWFVCGIPMFVRRYRATGSITGWRVASVDATYYAPAEPRAAPPARPILLPRQP